MEQKYLSDFYRFTTSNPMSSRYEYKSLNNVELAQRNNTKQSVILDGYDATSMLKVWLSIYVMFLFTMIGIFYHQTNGVQKKIKQDALKVLAISARNPVL